MSQHPLVTVIIPTRERCDVLQSALRTATAQQYPNLRIVVSDNCSSDATAEVVRQANDRRITYVNTGRRVSMSHNWEFALSHVEDGWVTFMGDDDGLMPDGIARVAAIIAATGARAIRTRPAQYEWPGVHPGEFGQLIVPLGSGMEERDARAWMQRMLQGRASYFDVPMLYNGGFMHFSLLDEVRRRTGTFFRSVNPDVYSAASLSSVVDRYLYVREPVAISGTSRHSNGNSFFSTQAQRNAAPKTVFMAEGNLPLHADVPALEDGAVPPSLQVCIYEAFLQSAALREDALDCATPEAQLPVILATSGRHRAVIDAWGQRFAAQHGIDFGAAQRRAGQLRWRRQGELFLRKVAQATGAVVTSRAPVRNVHEASIAAGVIRAAPGRRDTLAFFFRSLLALGK